ncbi:MAG: domain S-box protein [Hyphomicrobiales bacterium]|nr:domain S-box protein [Hyphomicrobiales bacterium]
MTGETRAGFLERALGVVRVNMFAQDSNRRYLWTSNAIMGVEPNDILGRTEADFLPPEIASRAIAEKEIVLATGEPRQWTLESRCDGESKIFQLRVEATRDEQGRINGLIGGAIDLTSDKQAVDNLRASERVLRDVIDHLFAFVGVLDLDGRIIEANRAPLEATGLTREDVIGRIFWECSWWSNSPAVQERLKDTIKRVRSGETLRYDVQMQVANGRVITLDFQLAPLVDETGRIVRLVASGTDITWRKNAERELQTALVRTELALEAGKTGVWEHDLATGELVWDARMRHLFGLSTEAPVTVELFESLVHREDLLKTREAADAATDPAGDGEYDVEYRLADRGNIPHERWIAARGRSIFEHGRAIRMIGIGRDVTERKQREAHVHMLMREIAHRSKNLLAVIQAMARQTATAGGTAKEFETRFTGRLEALAGSQDLLVMQDWHGASLHDLVRSQLVHYADLIGNRITVEGPDVMLKPEAAQNIGLALHELSTNAAKYGALSNENGAVHLTWTHDEHAEEPVLRMSWQETGGPAVSPPSREGFGHKVLKRIAAHALEGKVTLDFAPGGLIWGLEIPTSYIVRPRTREEAEKAEASPVKALSALGAVPLGGRV